MNSARLQTLGLTALALCAAPSLARAQALSTFLESAQQHNVDSRLSQEARLRAEAEFGEAWGSLLPSLSATGGWTHNQYEAIVEFPTSQTTTERVVITPGDQLDANLKVEVPIIDAAKWLKTSSSSAALSAAQARQRSSWSEVKRAVISAWYSLVAARAVLASANRSLAAAASQLDITASRTRIGVANELDLARSSAEVERNRQLVADAESLVATGGRSLRTLSGLEPGELPPLPTDDLHQEVPVEQLEARIDGLPQVEAANSDTLSAQRTLSGAGLALVPTVNAQFTQRFTNATGFQNQSSLYNAGLNFSWRLDVPAVQALRAQRSLTVTAELNAEKARLAARDQVHSDWQQVHAAVTKVRAAGAQVTAAQRATSLAHERYEAGVANQIDVIQAERDLFAAEVNHIQARGELASAREALRLSAGLE
jgi:outer membrane protein TolC